MEELIMSSNMFAEILAGKEEEKKREEEERELRSTFGGNQDFDAKAYTSLNEGFNVFRFIGKPSELRNKPTDVYTFFESQILKDDGKNYLKVVWPHTFENFTYKADSNSLLMKMYRKATEGKWVKYTESDVDGVKVKQNPDGTITNNNGKNGYKVFSHIDKPSHIRISGNAKPGEKYPKYFTPRLKVVANVIDRHDDWCKENKKTKILANSVKPFKINEGKDDETTIHFIDVGVGTSVYTAIMERMKDFSKTGNWEDCDIIISKKFKLNEQGKKKFDKYEIWDATDIKYLEDVKDIINAEPLTEEEKAYELWDLETRYKPTSAYTIEKQLGGLFKQFDIDFNENYYDQLQELVLAEKKEFEEKKKAQVDQEVQEEAKKEASETTPEPETKSVQEAQEKETSVEPVPSRRPVVQEETSTTTESTGDLFAVNFDSWNKVPKDEQDILRESIESFNAQGGPVYKVEVKSSCMGCSDATCEFKDGSQAVYPEAVSTCPVCGKVV
jgi:hypothetical protein